MSGWLGDAAVAHLRDVAEWPDAGERYEITRRLGRGGMGIVYAAQDRALHREVAIKVLDDLGPPADAEHLLAEARILGRLEHPGIVPVHDAGMLADGRVFYVMKLVRGDRLDACCRPAAGRCARTRPADHRWHCNLARVAPHRPSSTGSCSRPSRAVGRSPARCSPRRAWPLSARESGPPRRSRDSSKPSEYPAASGPASSWD